MPISISNPQISQISGTLEQELEIPCWRGLIREKFLAPNETEPQLAKEIYQSAPKGAYLGVGTERCFIAAVLNPNFDRLILWDNNSYVNHFNRINVALIKASPSRVFYKKLRLAKNAKVFSELLQQIGYERSPGQVDLSDKSLTSWFVNQLNSRKFDAYHYGKGEFKQLSYLHNDQAFIRIKDLADNNQIIVRNGDLSKRESLEHISEELNRAGVLLSCFDISNAWWGRYVSNYGSIDMSFLKGPDAFHPEGIVVVTDRQVGKPWFYLGFQRSQLELLLRNHPSDCQEAFRHSSEKDSPCLDALLARHAEAKAERNKMVEIDEPYLQEKPVQKVSKSWFLFPCSYV